MLKIKDFLSHVFLFSSLDEKELKSLTNLATSRTYKRGDIIFQQGEVAQSFFIVARGKVKISKFSKQGQEQIIHLHQDLDVVAEAAIFDNLKYPGTCMALEETVIVAIPKDDFVSLIGVHPQLALKMLASYSRRLREFVHTIESLTLKDVPQRVARLLLKMATVKDGVPTVVLEHSKKELALMINTTPESFSRALAKLKKDKIIREQKLAKARSQNLEILDIQKLKQLS